MSKQPLADEEPPPPYSAAPAPSSPCSSSAPQPGSQPQSSLFTHHLSSIREQMLREQAARLSARDQTDSQTLALLVPPVEALLESIAAIHPPPALVEATLVPDGAVGPDWAFSDGDEPRSGEVRTVVRVRREDAKLEGDRKRPPPSAGVDGWGRSTDAEGAGPGDDLWWSDEAMARRLAKHLQPERAAPPVDRQAVRAHVAQAKENRKASRWSLFKKDEPPPPPPISSPASSASASRDDVAMSVGAEEVTFRKENDLGIWESSTGWGVVVRVRIRNTGSSTTMDVLVTGSAGHLGTALMLTLPSLGFTPLGIDILASPTTTHVGSVSDRAFVKDVLAANPIRHVLHAATLHKPHVGSHSKQQFVETNVTGTLVLLEEAAALPRDQVLSFVFFSTTSTFGLALSPRPGSPAAWIDERVVPVPKNIYGVTKVAAEDMCALVHAQTRMPVLVLRTSRFFPEEDDDEDRRAAMGDANLKVLELAYRRCDIEDIVSAATCAMQRAREIGWAKYIISAPPPFANDAETLAALDRDPAAVFSKAAPGVDEVFARQGWKHLARVDRVYDSSKAVRELGWRPTYTFARTVEMVGRGEEWRSELVARVGKKGYHAVSTGVYTKR
ncbi:UDP-glucose 4-epimerase [Tolypocladium ophioglossoides CBS 100239]|uniref:UDP-glucose 4-epimerase n=1 Tax=Tolypocladium ophioglossoides (strain CBS 100239) TaxID=1163406 RepID=A0A0L0NJP2_TOLOC|nr:UDP-glucose 4-epimerase [Tolypocladium ophioglossoides CBS 100239]